MRDAPRHKQTINVVQRVDLPYVGVPARDVKQIFGAPLLLRFVKPAASIVIRKTGTKVELEVVAAMLEGALRLLPPDDMGDGSVTVCLTRHSQSALPISLE